MVRTRVGYAGGEQKNPTYHNLGDHTESFQIDYDPDRLSYSQLLDIFWTEHNPCARAGSRQYMSAVFYHDEGQRKLAVESKERVEKTQGRKVTTDILPLTKFYLAEDYHQKYRLRHAQRLLTELSGYYPDAAGLVNSTAAARINGYLGGNGTSAQLRGELAELGLSKEAGEDLQRAVDGKGK